jgi:hypothetical protein
MVAPAMIETTSVDAGEGSQRRAGIAKSLGLQRDHQRRDAANLFRRGIEANALCRERTDLIGGLRLDHRHALGIQPARQPARQHRAAHLPRTGEDDGALQVL